MTYTIVVSQPGFMPTIDPYTVDCREDAVLALAEEIDRTMDTIAESAIGYCAADHEDACHDAAEFLSVTIGGYCHEAVIDDGPDHGEID